MQELFRNKSIKTAQQINGWLISGIFTLCLIIPMGVEIIIQTSFPATLVCLAVLGLSGLAQLKLSLNNPKLLTALVAISIIGSFLTTQWSASLLFLYYCLPCLLCFCLSSSLYPGLVNLMILSSVSIYRVASFQDLLSYHNILLFTVLTLVSVIFYLLYRLQQILHKSEIICFKNLVRVACHDISNPLTLVLGSSQIAESGMFDKNPDKLKQLWPKITKSSEIINRLLISMRAYEAIQEPRRIHMENIDIHELARSVYVSHIDSSKKLGIEMNFDVQCPKGSTFIGDSFLLQQACFGAIVSNALRFADDQTSISAVIKFTSDNKNLQFQVKNQCTDASTDLFDNIFAFDFFNKPVLPQGQKHGGFALAVCQLILEVFHGSLELQVTSNQEGSPQFVTANIYLPLQTDSISGNHSI